MTTKTFDSTISQIPQDDSSVEYVAPEKNPITTIQTNELIFGQKHNDIDCALCPTAKRACDRAWVTAKQIENWSKMPKKTLWRRLNELGECERISRLQDFANVNIPTETGAVKTTLYNLNVLNQLAMVEMKNKVLNDTAKKFSDILSEVETTGSYGVTQPQPAMLPNFCNPAEAARAWADLYEKNQAIELRALTAESERDEDQSIDPILEDMADAHKTSPDTIREILRLVSIELQNAHSEHAFMMDGESADHFLN